MSILAQMQRISSIQSHPRFLDNMRQMNITSFHYQLQNGCFLLYGLMTSTAQSVYILIQIRTYSQQVLYFRRHFIRQIFLQQDTMDIYGHLKLGMDICILTLNQKLDIINASKTQSRMTVPIKSLYRSRPMGQCHVETVIMSALSNPLVIV